MRRLVMGVDASGRSCIAEQSDIVPAEMPGRPGPAIAMVFATDQAPPPSCPVGQTKFTGNGLPPGQLTWYIIEHRPRADGEPPPGAMDLHWRNAIDMIFVVEGGGEMLLGDGAHPVQAGDCIVMNGSDHRLQPSPQGCKLVAFALGTPPAS